MTPVSLPSVVRSAAGERRRDTRRDTRFTRIAISIPDNLFYQIDLCSRQLKVSRSRLLADAAREYLARRRAPLDATAAWNEVIAETGQPGDDPAALALRRRTKETLRAARAKHR